ncbi:GroES-like protein [Trametes maxima]|nr:GroES-like protein [Trametes maxima]
MTIPATQKSLVLHAESTPYVVEDTPVPRPGPNEVLVKIVACALNPVDAMIADPPFSKLLIPSYPFISGYDGAGVIAETGSEVTNRKNGDKILFQGTYTSSGATFQQYAVIPSEITALIPDNITFEQAATLPLALASVFIGLYNQYPGPENLSLRLVPIWTPEGRAVYAGKPIFIVGGASSLGQYAIQLAKHAGYTPIITTASLHNAPLLHSIGATHVLNRTHPNDAILAELRPLLRGQPLEYALVVVTAPDAMRLGRDALSPGGSLLTVWPSPSSVPEDISNPGDGKRVGYAAGGVTPAFNKEVAATMFQHVTNWLESGVLKPNPVEVLPNGLAGISDGLAQLKENKVSGTKLVAHPGETPQ